MSDYIERQKAIDYLMEIINRPNHPEWLWTDEICGSLKTIPAADVRPVVRASWEEKEKDGVWWYACSACGEHIPKGQWGQEWHSRFCPNCGARMEES